MSAWSRWKALLARTETGEALALFRIAVGVCVLWSFVVPLFHDVALIIWSSQGYRGQGPAPATLYRGMALGIAASSALLLGLGGRLTALVTLQLCLWLFGLNPNAGGSHDRLITNALWLLVLGNGTATLSLDCRLRCGAWTSDRRVFSWPRYLAIYQLVIMYQATGVQKISPEWTPFGDFSALWYILRAPGWQRVSGEWMPFWATQLATAATWIWEWCAWVWLYAFWARDRRGPEHWANRFDLRTKWALWGLGMHAALYVLTVLGALSLVTMAWYPCLWHPDEYRSAWRRLSDL